MAETMPKSLPDVDADESELRGLLANPRPSCPPLDVLLAYTEDVLPAEQKEAVRVHLASCRLCPLLLADFATLPEPELSAAQFDRIAAKLPSRMTGARAKTSRYALIGIAAALLVAVLISFGLRSRGAQAPTVASVTLPKPLPPAAAAAVPEIAIFPLAPPEGMLTRGAVSGKEPSFDQLMPAFAPYNRGDYAAASDRFTKLRTEYPQSEIAALYLGISQLFMHQDEKAYVGLMSLKRTHTVSTDAVQWYTAVAAERTHAADASKRFNEICANKSSRWSMQSCGIESQRH